MRREETPNLGRARSRERFVELAEKRVSRAMNDMRLIANLLNRSNYSYDKHDVQKIIRALEDQLKEVKQAFDANARKGKQEFKL